MAYAIGITPYWRHSYYAILRWPAALRYIYAVYITTLLQSGYALGDTATERYMIHITTIRNECGDV